MEQEIVELGLPFVVETNDLAVEDDGVLQFSGEGYAECPEGLELVSIPGDELAAPVLDVSQRRVAVELDLEQPVLMGEWFRTTSLRSGWNFIREFLLYPMRADSSP